MKKIKNENRYWTYWYLIVLVFLLLQILFYNYLTQLYQ